MRITRTIILLLLFSLTCTSSKSFGSNIGHSCKQSSGIRPSERHTKSIATLEAILHSSSRIEEEHHVSFSSRSGKTISSSYTASTDFHFTTSYFTKYRLKRSRSTCRPPLYLVNRRLLI